MNPLRRTPYSSRSSTQRVTIPSLMAAVQQLHLEAVIAEIKQTNQKFERQFVRPLEAEGQTGEPRVRELVQQTADAYRTLVEHVSAHALLTPAAGYTLFSHHLNENVEHFNLVVERRKQVCAVAAEEAAAAPEVDDEVGE